MRNGIATPHIRIRPACICPYKVVTCHAASCFFLRLKREVACFYASFIVKMSQPGSQNVPSNLLSHEENDLVFTLVGQRKQVREESKLALICDLVFFLSPPNTHMLVHCRPRQLLLFRCFMPTQTVTAGPSSELEWFALSRTT